MLERLKFWSKREKTRPKHENILLAPDGIYSDDGSGWKKISYPLDSGSQTADATQQPTETAEDTQND